LRRAEPWSKNADQLVNGAAENFDAVYQQWVESVRRWVQIFGAAPADRDDLVQDVFLIVHRRLAAFDGTNVRGWLYQITKRRVRDYHLSAWMARVLRVRDIATVIDVTTHPGPDHDLQQRDQQELLNRLLGSLSDEQRAAFVMFEVDARSGAEIAAIQGASVATVWVRIHRARQRLRQLLRRASHRSAAA
jgi:RNA polymerase sigma-70 factor (ECF subfamily)